MYKTLKLLFAFLIISYPLPAQTDFAKRLTIAAIELTKDRVGYDATYYRIPYPNGDVPKDRGVCTDVVIRAYRKLGIDLQQLVHEDMKSNFALYPKNWGLKKTDTNIDHRRVPNLMKYFSRNGTTLSISNKADDYKPGDIVTWDLGGNVPHIGIVINQKSSDNKTPLIVHNIGAGQEISDCLFRYTITGHYRYSVTN
jgi:uncharacterized protein